MVLCRQNRALDGDLGSQAPRHGKPRRTANGIEAAPARRLVGGERMSDRDYGLPRKYELLEKLSEGGMGEVLKVRHRHLDEVQVVKVVLPRFAEDAELRERFLREARVAVQLRHPNVAQIYDLTVGDDEVAFLGMEYIDGTDLAAVRRRRRLEIHEVIDIGLQALSALEYLHQKGFVHRDISPENLMLAERFDGRPLVKLIDLGIAKHLERDIDLTREGTFVGKVRYAAPEQFRGEAVDHSSDLYSLGVVLYELATGTHPVPGTTTEEIIAGHLMRPPLPFSQSDAEGRVPERLRAALEKALAKAKEDRFASARDFARALEAVDTPLAATVVSPAPAELEPTRVAPSPGGAAPTVLTKPASEGGGRAAEPLEPTRLAPARAGGNAPSPSAPPGEGPSGPAPDRAAPAAPLREPAASPPRRRAARPWLLAFAVALLLGVAAALFMDGGPADPLDAILSAGAADAGALALSSARSAIPIGEPVSLDLASDEAGFLLLLARDSAGDVVVLYPNGMRDPVEVVAGENQLPLPEDVARGFQLLASEPLGEERFLAIRSVAPVALPQLEGAANPWFAAFPRTVVEGETDAEGGTDADGLLEALATALEPVDYAAATLTVRIVPAPAPPAG